MVKENESTEAISSFCNKYKQNKMIFIYKPYNKSKPPHHTMKIIWVCETCVCMYYSKRLGISMLSFFPLVRMSSLLTSGYFLGQKNKLNSMLLYFIFFSSSFFYSSNGTVHSAKNTCVLNNFLATAQPVPDHERSFLRFISHHLLILFSDDLQVHWLLIQLRFISIQARQ